MIPLFKVFMSNDVQDKLAPVLSGGYITQGPKVKEFEKQLSAYLDHPYICTVNSATSGLTLALRLLDLKPGDEILCPPLSCFATIAPSLTSHLHIKWVDVDPETCNLNLDDLETKLTDKTKAILLVHWGGNPVDLDRLHAIRDAHVRKFSHPIPIIEDCAHSFGAEYQGRKIGSHGNLCVFSTQAIKHLTTGDGGFLCLPNEEMLKRAKLLRWYGIDRENSESRMYGDIIEAGYKFHMNDIAATIGLANLPHIQKNIDYTRRLAERYTKELSTLHGVRPTRITKDAQSAYWLYTINIIDRDQFLTYMKQHNIQVSQVHDRLDKYTCTQEFETDLPRLDSLHTTMVCIPLGWWVTNQNATLILSAIHEWCRQLVVRELAPTPQDFTDYKHVIYQLNQLTLEMTFDEWASCYQQMKSQHSFVYGLEYRGKVIGTAKVLVEFKFGKNVGHIEDVVVDEQWRHYGLGTMLVKKCVETATTMHCYKILLNTHPTTSAFYKSIGFQYEKNEYVLRI